MLNTYIHIFIIICLFLFGHFLVLCVVIIVHQSGCFIFVCFLSWLVFCAFHLSPYFCVDILLKKIIVTLFDLNQQGTYTVCTKQCTCIKKCSITIHITLHICPNWLIFACQFGIGSNSLQLMNCLVFLNLLHCKIV